MPQKFFGQIEQADVNGLSTALGSKAPANHTHDDRYYTESETNTLLDGKITSSGPYGYFENRSATSFSAASGAYRLIPFPFTYGWDRVTRSTDNTIFTLGAAGVWSIEAGIRFANAQANQTRYLAIVWPSNTVARYAETACYQTGTGGSLNVARTVRCTEANWQFGIGAISTGTTGFSVANDTSYTTFVSFTWIRPL